MIRRRDRYLYWEQPILNLPQMDDHEKPNVLNFLDQQGRFPRQVWEIAMDGYSIADAIEIAAGKRTNAQCTKAFFKWLPEDGSDYFITRRRLRDSAYVEGRAEAENARSNI